MYSFQRILVLYFLISAICFKHKTLVKGFGMNLIKVPDDDLSQVVCSMSLLRKYYNSGESLSGSVLYMSLTTATMHTQKKLLEAIHAMDDFPWSVVIRDPKNLKSTLTTQTVLHEKPQCYFVVIENLEDDDLEDIFEDWKVTVNWNPLAQFVVYLASIEETDEEMTELMIEILLSFMNKKIYNVNVIGQSEENGYYYGKTVFPYHPDNNCGNRVISIETLDVCDFHIGERSGGNEDEDNDVDEDNGDFDENGDDGVDGGGGDDENDDSGIGNNNDEGDANDNDGGDDTAGGEENENDFDDNGNDRENGEDNERNNDGDTENGGENDENNTVDTENGGDNDDNIGATENGGDNDENNAVDTENGGDNDDNIGATENGGDNDENNAIDTENEVDNDDDADEAGKGENKENGYDKSTENTVDGNANKKDSIESNDDASVGFKDFREKSDQNSEFSNEVYTKKAHKKLTEYKPKKYHRRSVFKKGKNRKGKYKERVAREYRRNVLHRLNPQRSFSFKKIREQPISLSPKFMRLETELSSNDTDKDSSNQTNNQPHLYLEEIYRALFLDKFPKDLSGCPLAAAYRPWEPYIFTEKAETVQENTTGNSFSENNDYDNGPRYSNEGGFTDYMTEISQSTDENGGIHLSGIEFQLLQTIGERLHIHIDLQIENSNLYHLFQQLIDGDIEMVIGGIDEDPSMSQYVSTTIPYHQDDLTWCVAKARRSYSLFNFLASFSWVVWLVSFVYIIVASLTITWIKRLLRMRIKYLNGFFSVMFRVFGIIFNQSMPLVIKHGALRFAFYSTFFLALIFINAYQSFLISTLTTPQSAYQISRVEEIYKNRMTIKGSVENVRHLNKQGEIFKYIREKFQMCYNIEECLMEAAENDNIAVAVSRQHSFYNPRIPRSRLYCFDRNENIYVYLVTMLLPKKFHLLHKINPVIQYVIESGHMQKWARDLDMRRKILEERKHALEDKFRSLTLGQVVGTFVFTGALLCIAILALLVECCVHRLSTKRRRTRLKIIKFLHRQFLRA